MSPTAGTGIVPSYNVVIPYKRLLQEPQPEWCLVTEGLSELHAATDKKWFLIWRMLTPALSQFYEEYRAKKLRYKRGFLGFIRKMTVTAIQVCPSLLSCLLAAHSGTVDPVERPQEGESNLTARKLITRFELIEKRKAFGPEPPNELPIEEKPKSSKPFWAKFKKNLDAKSLPTTCRSPSDFNKNVYSIFEASGVPSRRSLTEPWCERGRGRVDDRSMRGVFLHHSPLVYFPISSLREMALQLERKQKARTLKIRRARNHCVSTSG
eukprot:748108-Hanusia_phi.AAC.2